MKKKHIFNGAVCGLMSAALDLQNATHAVADAKMSNNKMREKEATLAQSANQAASALKAAKADAARAHAKAENLTSLLNQLRERYNEGSYIVFLICNLYPRKKLTAHMA